MIIGLNGKMGVGKTEAVEIIRRIHKDKEFEVVKFAQPLYDMQEFIYRRIKTVYARPDDFTKDRKLLQWLGTEWGRGTISENIWIDLWREEVEFTRSNGTHVINDDTRFDNEAETIRALGGKVIQITSNRSADRINTTSGIVDHSSEAGLTPGLVDAIITNNGTLDEFEEQLKFALRNLGLNPSASSK